MKVLFLKSRLSHRGGLEKYTIRLAQAFARHDCEVTILTTGEAPQLDRLEVLSLGDNGKFSLYQIREFDYRCQKWLRENPHEIIFGMEWGSYHTHYRAGNGVHASYLEQRALVDSRLKRLSFRINPLHQLLLKKQKKAYEHHDLKMLFTNSEMVRNEILQRFSTPPEKIHVVHNGVEWEDWSISFEQTPKRSGPYQLLFVGHNYRRKGLHFLLKGLELIKDEIQLTVVGKGESIPSKNVYYAGPQTNLIPFYQRADALVIPSIYDPFANVTVEALAMGLFVVSSKYNGGREVLTPNSGCTIEELTSPESMAVAIKIALSHPKTIESAQHIRNSIKELDFSNQLDKIVRKCIL